MSARVVLYLNNASTRAPVGTALTSKHVPRASETLRIYGGKPRRCTSAWYVCWVEHTFVTEDDGDARLSSVTLGVKPLDD